MSNRLRDKKQGEESKRQAVARKIAAQSRNSIPPGENNPNAGKHTRTHKAKETTPISQTARQAWQKPPAPQVAHKRNIAGVWGWIKAHKVVAVLFSVIGIVASFIQIYTSLPRFTVAPIGMLAPANALSTQFEISNSGFMDAIELEPMWVVKQGHSGLGMTKLTIANAGL